MKVLFLTQTSQIGPASRYRVYQYLQCLESEGIECVVSPALNTYLSRCFYGASNPWQKLPFVFLIVFRRFIDLFRVRQYDLVFIQREILPQVFPFLEKLIFMLNKNIVFDFDDAIFLVPPQRKSFLYGLRYRNNIKEIVCMSKAVIVGNDYLKSYALRFNSNVYLIPTSIDMERWPDKEKEYINKTEIVIGWIGSVHTLFYLRSLSGVLKKISLMFRVKLFVIGVKEFMIEGVDVIAKDWRQDTEREDLKKIDIGLAPLFDDEWGRGKCGLKALQYMVCGIPLVCSNAGVYKQMIADGVNGFLASNENEWVDKLTLLIKDASLRRKLAESARQTLKQKYSLIVNAQKLKLLLKKVVTDKE